jgi:hypothetical protein
MRQPILNMDWGPRRGRLAGSDQTKTDCGQLPVNVAAAAGPLLRRTPAVVTSSGYQTTSTGFLPATHVG